MLKIEKVFGSKEQAKPLIVTADVVYLHTGISSIEENRYAYTEYQLTIPEFLEVVFSSSDIEELIKKLEVQT